ncbi:MAG: histidine--tRNA ligase [Acidimicrobiales bacterium]
MTIQVGGPPGGPLKGSLGGPLKGPTGTNDILPPESRRWEVLLARFAEAARLAGYGLVMTPMFEDAALFDRGVGATTDVVSKEMYVFEDRGGRQLALRPEGTAPVARAFLEHHPQLPFKAWYAAPAFRYERPQHGRYRQHHQVGAEVLGTGDPGSDVEVCALAWRFLGSLGLARVELAVNSMGDAACRPAYREALVAYLGGPAGRGAGGAGTGGAGAGGAEARLCAEHREKWRANPLRVLDCKRAECRDATAVAPRSIDWLCGPCSDHLAGVTSGLSALGIPFTIDHHLVRGLDYYTRTVFEITSSALTGALNVLGGAGRYDGLVGELGGAETAGVGFAIGVERVLLALDAEGALAAGSLPSPVQAYVVDTTGGQQATLLADELRRSGIATDRAFDNRSMKSQMRSAGKSGAAAAVIVGPDELQSASVSLRWLVEPPDGDQVQQALPREGLAAALRAKLARAFDAGDEARGGPGGPQGKEGT